MNKLTKTLEAIDILHQNDPQQIMIEGKNIGKELLYAQQMSTWLVKLQPKPNEIQQISVRSQHLCRWQLARNQYEMNRSGYLTWRKEQGIRHAEKAVQVMNVNGYSQLECDTVYNIVSKKRVKGDANTQIMEDCACLVFLEFQFAKFIENHSIEKNIRIVQKTWLKMSEQAHQFALQLPFSAAELSIIEQALA